MATDLTVPPAGESVTEVTFIKWSRQDGELVKEGDPVAEVETDKANADIFANGTGVLKHVAGVAQGTVLKIGAKIGSIDPAAKPTATAAKAEPKPAAKSESPARVEVKPEAKPAPKSESPASAKLEDLSPATRRAVVEAKIDPTKVTATGPGGRLTKEDVESHVAKSNGASAPTSAPTSAPAAVQVVPAKEGARRAPMSKIRKRIAENLVRAKNTTAMLTTFNEADMSAIMKLRATYKEAFEKKHGIGLGFMGFFVKACCIALKEFERVNGQIEGDDILLFDHVHMGVAVSTERGLTVPVVKHADKLGFAQIESEIKRLATNARDGKLGLDEMSGGTFTITNGGIFGSLLSTPIINPPQSAILGMHAIKDRAVVIDGKIEVRPIMNLALSYDHRIIDGKESVSFLVKVKNLLEDPSRLLLDI
jgi:2-oxoglutarate dehydrogenase E2 component (dihydrolipoamide succinyltransferase)